MGQKRLNYLSGNFSSVPNRLSPIDHPIDHRGTFRLSPIDPIDRGTFRLSPIDPVPNRPPIDPQSTVHVCPQSTVQPGVAATMSIFPTTIQEIAEFTDTSFSVTAVRVSKT
jgi:hypothetical protein